MKRRIAWLLALIVLAGCAPAATPTPEVIKETMEVPVEVTVEVPVEVPAEIKSELPVDVSRDKVFVLDQIFRYAVIDNFNFFVPGPASPTQQGLVYDTLWYLDSQTGESINSLAKEKAIYNDDYTEMTVNLREGVYWSDGVEFTADDLVFTVNTLKNTPGMVWAADMALYVKDVTKTDDYTVVFTLNEPNSRLHYYFTPGYNAIYMMAKHVWEKAEDPKTFANFPPVSLGAYLYEDSDPAGFWVLFKRRGDWERTTPGMLTGKPGPEYILTIFYGGSERKAIAMSRHELDLFMDVDYEAFKAILETTPTARSWFKDFPWAYPNELDSRYFGFNHTLAPYDNKDVRWALTLATDIVDLQTNYIGGVTRVTPIPLPATTLMMDLYALPLEPWLKELTIDVGNGETFKPYDPDVPKKIAEWAKEQGYTVPEDAEGLRDRFGMGWWKYAPDIAEKLLLKNGFTKGADGKWLLPDGTPWKIKMIAAPDEADAYRLAIGFQDQMRKFGIEVEVESLERDPYYTRQLLGDFEATSAWVAFRVLASPDLWYGLNTMHSRFYTPVGEPAPDITINPLRVESPELDRIIDEMGALSPDDPKATELAQEALKWWVENMITTTTISFKKFITMDEYYWTGWPTADRPDWQPLYWFMGGRFPLMYVELAE